MAVIGAFPVMIGLGIDYGIQFHARLDEEARKGSLDKAVSVMITRTGPAVMYAMLATCMGFIAMFISTVPMIRSFGLVAMIGVMSCFVISLIGIPTIAHLVNYTPKQQKTELCYAVSFPEAHTDSTGYPAGENPGRIRSRARSPASIPSQTSREESCTDTVKRAP